jgi:hypothetical protein
MPPAEERFVGLHATGAQVDHGLVIQLEAALRDRVPQVSLEAASVEHVVAHLLAESGELPSAS